MVILVNIQLIFQIEFECFHRDGENERILGIKVIREGAVLSNSKPHFGLVQTTNLFLPLAAMRVKQLWHSRVWVAEMASPVASFLRSIMRTLSGPSFSTAEELSATVSAATLCSGGLLICSCISSKSTS